MRRYIAQQVVAEQRDAVTRKVQDMFPEINLPQLKQTPHVAQRRDGTASAAPAAAQPAGLGRVAAGGNREVRASNTITKVTTNATATTTSITTSTSTNTTTTTTYHHHHHIPGD